MVPPLLELVRSNWTRIPAKPRHPGYLASVFTAVCPTDTSVGVLRNAYYFEDEGNNRTCAINNRFRIALKSIAIER